MGDIKDFSNINYVEKNDLFKYDTKYNPRLNGPFEMETKDKNSNSTNKIPEVDTKSHKEATGDFKRDNWKNLLFDFAMTTTFHGPKLIVQPQPFCMRRTLWLLLFLAGTAIFLIQTYTSVARYRSYPVSVNVKINYNTSIAFPAVTLCNGNAFRSTKAYEHGYYDMITEVFDVDKTNLSEYTTAPNLEDLYMALGHSQSDLIVSCSWYNQPCKPSDFLTLLTDYGKCYTFNSGKNSNPVKKAYETGTKGGLRLQLNIEQYEYMVGPNAGAGLKVLIHNPDDIPLVRDHGLAVPPGSHGLIGIKTLEVNNLPPNYGICNDSVKLEYFDQYTIPNCYTNCKEKYMMYKCNCRDIYMPHGPDTPPVCNITSYNTCMYQADDEFNNKIKESCQQHCPVPCNSVLYDPAVSYASISNFDIETLLRGNSTEKLRESFMVARETTQRVNPGIVEQDTALISNLNATVHSLDDKFKEMKSQLDIAKHSLNTSYVDILQRIKFHMDRGLEAVEYIVAHDFIRGWDVYKERAFHFVSLNFMDFSQLLKTVVTRANKSNILSDMSNRQLLYSPIEAHLISRKTLIERAIEFINNTKEAYVTGKPLLTYRLTYERRYDMFYISVPLLHTGIAVEELNFNTLVEGCKWMDKALTILIEVGEQFVNSGYFNETKFQDGEYWFLKGGRRYNYRLFMYESRVIHTPLEEIQKRIEHFLRLNRTLNQHQEDVEWKITQIEELMDNSVQHWQTILEVLHSSINYLSDTQLLKSPLSITVTSKALAESIRLLTIFFQDIRSRVRELQDMMASLVSSYKDMWSSMFEEESTKKFYHKLYNDSQSFLLDNSTNNREYLYKVFAHLLRTESSVLKLLKPEDIITLMNGDLHGIQIKKFIHSLEVKFLNLSKSLDLSVQLGDLDALFLTHFEEYKTSMMNFVEGNSIDTNFFKQNFMTLDVFMQELSYEEIKQQEAYDVTQMLSEIGGSMGLFIGGSVISIFEFLDVFIHNGARIALNQ